MKQQTKPEGTQRAATINREASQVNQKRKPQKEQEKEQQEPQHKKSGQEKQETKKEQETNKENWTHTTEKTIWKTWERSADTTVKFKYDQEESSNYTRDSTTGTNRSNRTSITEI